TSSWSKYTAIARSYMLGGVRAAMPPGTMVMEGSVTRAHARVQAFDSGSALGSVDINLISIVYSKYAEQSKQKPDYGQAALRGGRSPASGARGGTADGSASLRLPAAERRARQPGPHHSRPGDEQEQRQRRRAAAGEVYARSPPRRARQQARLVRGVRQL